MGNSKKKNKNAIPKFSEIENPEVMIRYLKDNHRFNGRKFIYHYTTVDRLKDIFSSGSFYLSKMMEMNDLVEVERSDSTLRDKLFIASFLTEEQENIGMWSMYAQPWQRGVKIAFPTKEFRKWIMDAKIITVVDNCTHKLTDETIALQKDLCSLSFVAYDDSNITNKKTIRTTWSTVNNRKLKKTESAGLLTGYIKDEAWCYEKELRILVRIDDMENVSHIALRLPDELLAQAIITTGPLFEGCISDYLDDMNKKPKVDKSRFTGKLNIHTNMLCDKYAVACLLPEM
jgi:hypothetical protein